MKADLMALSAVVLWSSLAAITIQLTHLPPLLLTGTGLLIGSALALPLSGFRLRESWRLPFPTLALGIFGLFGYHLALFFALQNAPAAEANLINYLWPVGIVLLSPLLLRGYRLSARHIVAVLLGFTGAATAIMGSQVASDDASAELWPYANWGFLSALAAATIWALYSVLTKKVPSFSTAAVGLFGLISGLLAVGLHLLLEEPYVWQVEDLPWLVALGLGPLGLAFYLWDRALKLGDPRRIGIISFLTPLLSTMALLAAQQQGPSASILLAAILIVGAGLIGMASKKSRSQTS